MAMVNVVTIGAYRWIYWLKLIGLLQRSSATWRCLLHSSDEPGELSQGLCTATMTALLTLSWLLVLLLLLVLVLLEELHHFCIEDAYFDFIPVDVSCNTQPTETVSKLFFFIPGSEKAGVLLSGSTYGRFWV